jgi:hypothetical protein
MLQFSVINKLNIENLQLKSLVFISIIYFIKQDIIIVIKYTSDQKIYFIINVG